MILLLEVDSWEEIHHNIKIYDSYRDSKNTLEREFFLNLMKRGICFIAYDFNNNISFYPSRYIGYFKNNLNLHSKSKLSGLETNDAISYILGYSPTKDEKLDEYFQVYSQKIGLFNNDRGAFGKQRKYWYVGPNLELSSRFESLKQKENIRRKKRKIQVPFNEDYDVWKFTILGDSYKITSGEIKIPIINKALVEVKGKMVSELLGYFEFYKDKDKWSVRVNRWNDFNKHQKFIVLKNVKLKLREILYK